MLHSQTERALDLLQSLAVAIVQAPDERAGVSLALRKICESTAWTSARAWAPSESAPSALVERAWRSRRVERLENQVAMPVFDGGDVILVLEFSAAAGRPLDPAHVELLSSVVPQLGAFVRRKQIERELAENEQHLALALESERRARAVAERAVAERAELLSTVSHDLKSPLASILANAELIEERPGESQTRARAICQHTTTMVRLIQDLVDVAAIETGRLSLARAQHPVEGLVTEAVQMFHPIAERGRVRLKARVEPAAQHVRVGCDRDRISQVLSNLVANAIRQTPPSGEAEVRAALRGKEVVFSVADTGSGLPDQSDPFAVRTHASSDASMDSFGFTPREREVAELLVRGLSNKEIAQHLDMSPQTVRCHLVKVFSKAGVTSRGEFSYLLFRARTYRFGGTGLGLFIAKTLVEAHGGRIWAETRKPCGSEFSFAIPLGS
jgi:signal transduction histidine kinase